MRLKYKEDPREWRKSGLLTLGGLTLISSLLRWRHLLRQPTWVSILAALGITALVIEWKPRWFRGYYRISLWIGFHLSQWVGKIILLLFFIFIISPIGIFMRLLGKDPLRLQHLTETSYWQKAKESTPLNSQF